MKKGQIETIGGIIFLILLLSSILPTVLQEISNISGIDEVREELEKCKLELSSARERLSELEEQNRELNSLIINCESKLQNLTTNLLGCSQNLSSCKENLGSANEEIESLSNCWEELGEYKEELADCRQLNKTIMNRIITPDNFNQYFLVFSSLEIKLEYIILISFISPLIGELVSFKFISVEAKFRRKNTQETIFLFKSFTCLLPMGIWISFFLKTPLIPTLILVILGGLILSEKIFQYSYKNKVDSILEFIKIETKYLDEKRKKKK